MFKRHKKKLRKVVKQTMKDMSSHVAAKLTDADVPVRTGRYVKSHVVQTSMPSFPRSAEKEDPPFPPSIPGTEIKMAERSKIKAVAKILIETNETIHFGNAAPYAHLVEFLGWTPIGGETGPYHVFGKAAGSLEANRKRIATIAKKKVFK